MNKLYWFVCIVSIILASSCKTAKVVQSDQLKDSIYQSRDSVLIEYKYVEVPVEVPVVLIQYVTKEKYDSIYHRDSTYVREKNDTIYMYKEKNVYKYVIKTDTLHKIDSIPVVVHLHDTVYKEIRVKNDSISASSHDRVITNTVEVNKLKWWLKILIWIGAIASIIGLAWGSFKLGKLYFK